MKRRHRGFSLFAIIVFSVLILSGALVLLSLGRESQISGIQEKQGNQAYGLAQTGLQWQLANLATNAGKDLAVEIATSGTAQVFNGKRLFRFDPADRYAGVVAAPPAKGSSDANWTSFGDGHYALLVAIDPLDTRRSVLIRSIGVVGETQVVLETSLVLNLTQTVPSGFTGCYESDFQIKFKDEEGPYDYTGQFRIDGNLGVPMAISADHNRINGFARENTSAGPAVPSADPGYTVGRKWRGSQSLRTGLLPSGVSNRYGGQQTPNLVQDEIGPITDWERNPWIANDPRLVDAFSTTIEIGPITDWERNPWIANDPRLVDAFSTTIGSGPKGLRLNEGGFVYGGGNPTVADFTGFSVGAVADTDPIQGMRGSPLIAYLEAPTATTNGAGGLLGQAAWAGERDDEARKGLYACDDHSGVGTQNNATEVCIKGTKDAGGPDWRDDAVNHSGRAWGIMQSVLRQCTGSGSSINPVTGSPFKFPLDANGDTVPDNPNGIACSQGFEWLENVAACMILPQTVAQAVGTNALRDPLSDGNNANNFAGCHPGCLIATDIDGDNDIDNDDRPFRSACINLDASKVSAYGPGAYPAKDKGGVQFDTAYGPDAANSRWAAWNNTRLDALAANPNSDGDSTKDAVDDDNQPARFAPEKNAAAALLPAGQDSLPGGAVGERGNPNFIARLDMSDRGPLGTCEQNCLAYGWGKDVTYGAHRTDIASPGTIGTAALPANCVARVPAHSAAAGATTLMHCNWDSNYDGILDRKSFALASSYREECADPHDGMAWTPAFNVSSKNTNLAGAGCRNDMPGMHPDTKPMRLVPFCEDGNDADLEESIDAIEATATEVKSDVLNKKGALTDGNGWFGGAVCHMGSGTTFGGTSPHPHTGPLAGLSNDDVDQFGHDDFWIEDVCPDPVVLKVDSSADINFGEVCGCGVLIFGENSFKLTGQSTFLWRGLVIWRQKTAGKTLRIDGADTGTFHVEGALIATGVEGMNFELEKGVGSSTIISTAAGDQSVKFSFRMNPFAIEEALSAVKPPIRTVRRVR